MNPGTIHSVETRCQRERVKVSCAAAYQPRTLLTLMTQALGLRGTPLDRSQASHTTCPHQAEFTPGGGSLIVPFVLVRR